MKGSRRWEQEGDSVGQVTNKGDQQGKPVRGDH